MNIIVRNSDNMITMFSADNMPEAPSDCHSVTLTEEQTSELQQLFQTPNGGVKFDGTAFTILPPLWTPKDVAVCTPWQFRAELRARNLKTEVDALVAASSIAAQDAYEYATSFDSNNALLLQLASQLSTPLTPDDVYNMIVSASQRQIGS